MAGEIVVGRTDAVNLQATGAWIFIKSHGHGSKKTYTLRPAGLPSIGKTPETIESRVGIGGTEPPMLGIGAQKGAPPARPGRGAEWQRIERVGGVFELSIPIRGLNQAFSVTQQPDLTSGDLLNVRPKDVLERRIRIGKRAGMVKAYAEQIGSTNVPYPSSYPVVAMCQIVVVE